MYLAKMTTVQVKEVFENDPIIVIPIGSTEQHGTHGALGTDFMIPSFLADQIADMENILVAPTLPYGVCPYHLSFAGSIDIGYEGLYMVLRGIMGSLMKQGAKRFLILNGHGGNNPSIDKAALEVYENGGICACIDWWSLVGQLNKDFAGGHGDALETSAMMAIAPEAVHLDLCREMNPVSPSEETKVAYIQAIGFRGGTIRIPRDTKETAPNGWFGPCDPRESTKEFGQAALELVASYIREFLCEMKKIT